ncbi:UNVERIFIED_CONTAM: hypothetical protein HDU68_009052 [Siphonaria sp. JEL0065]|nr:hypothetical protein HDU68_009052 [Siphonaria sp. JEL0065]
MGASSFTSNPLLVKDSVGKTRPTVFDLPGDDHIYGKKVERNPEECAAQAKQGILSPRAIRDYRKEHPVRMKIGDHNLFGSDGVGAAGPNGEALTSAEARKMKLLGTLPHDNDPNFREWIAQEVKRNALSTQQEKERLKKKILTTPAQRKSDILESKPKKVLLVDKDPKTLFKMSKFLSQGPKISSWRNDLGEGITTRSGAKSNSNERKNRSETTAQRDLDRAINGIANLTVKKLEPVSPVVPQAICREEKLKVRFIGEPVASGSEKLKVFSSLEPSPAANKKLLAAPGAAPVGWTPSN